MNKMNWDPSMATTTCRKCGCCIEAWISICEECEEREVEEAKILLQEFNQFRDKFEELIGDGRDIAARLENNHGESTTAERFRSYLLNRMENFLEGGEMFHLEEVGECLKDIIGEEN